VLLLKALQHQPAGVVAGGRVGLAFKGGGPRLAAVGFGQGHVDLAVF
jgi:hypothetical protein